MITRRCLLLLLLFSPLSLFAQENCNYILNKGLDKITVYDLDGLAELVYDTVAVPAAGAFEIEKDWILLPDEITDTSMVTHIDYEINTDTVLRIVVDIPLRELTCIETMEEDAREQFFLEVMEKMYQLFYQENTAAGNRHQTLQDYSPGTRSFFYHSFYWVEGYLGGAAIYNKESPETWSRYLYTISNDVWGNAGDGRSRIARLFATRPSLFAQAFGLISRMQNRHYIKEGIMDHLKQYLYEPAFRFESSEVNRLFREHVDKKPEERAVSMLEFYQPYLSGIGFSEPEIQSLLQ